jgi:hypothetical protein
MAALWFCWRPPEVLLRLASCCASHIVHDRKEMVAVLVDGVLYSRP